MKITDVAAIPVSVVTPPAKRVRLAIGTAVKRDAVIVKVTTEDGVTGFGESHHGRAPGAVAHLVNSTIRELVVGRDAFDTCGVWDAVYRKQLASHGLGAAAAIALSGVDMALWDLRGKASGLPLYRLLGGGARTIPAYAGGVALGYDAPTAVAERAGALTASGYRAVKLRVGDSAHRDIARIEAVREAVGGVEILVDANCGYHLADARHVIPHLDRLGVGWLEEPFASHDHRSYAAAAKAGRVPLAAGENHYTRFEFHRLIDDGVVSILQPDLSKAGGVTEVVRIAAMASAWKIPIHPHTSMTGLNMAATVHLLASIDNAGYFEADVSEFNPFRDDMVSQPFSVDDAGCVRPLERPGIGIDVDEAFLAAHPLIDGPSYV
ncbi:mandelate racemase/muconate lactonizing enzyme family protein [Mycolicibacterium sp.]|uniref:mandelate racemase/muconate lactonizing enzyme family protein n=1 Tax=Mycolicibacterium sp. TaxID=2320850 RepID=UPI003D0F58C7